MEANSEISCDLYKILRKKTLETALWHYTLAVQALYSHDGNKRK